MTTTPNPNASNSNYLDREIADLLVFSVWELRQAANRAFEPLAVTTFHVAILNFVADDPQLHSSDLARCLDVSREATSATLTTLTEQGLLKRVVPEHDQRVRTFSLTEAGETLRLEANRLWQTAITERYAGMEQGDKEDLLRLLKIVHS